MHGEARQTAMDDAEPGAAAPSPPAGQPLPQVPSGQQTALEIQNEELRLSLARTNVLLSRYFDFYDMAPVGFCTVDESGHILQANLATGTLLGLARHAVLQQSFTRFIHPDFQNIYHLTRQGVPVAEAPQACELKIVKKNGTWFWARLEIRTVKAEAGTALQYIVLTNISAHKRIESIQSARLRLMEFSIHHTLKELLVATLDEVGTLTDSPIGFYHFLAADQKTLSLQAWSTRTAKEYCRATGEGRHYDIDEAGVWVECVRLRRPVIHNDYSSLPNKRGLPPGHAELIREMVVPVFRNDNIVAILGVGNKASLYDQEDMDIVALIADLVWEFVETKRAEVDVQENERRWKFVLEGSGEFAWDWNVQSGTVAHSKRWNTMLGYADEQIGSHFDDWMKLVHPDERDLVLAASNAHLNGQTPNYVVRYRVLCKDGSWKWIMSRGMVFARSPDGRPLRVVGTSGEVGERTEVTFSANATNRFADDNANASA